MENLKCLFCNFPWDIFLFSLLLGLLLWWLLSQLLKRRYSTHTETRHDDSALRDRINYLETELEACREAKASMTTNILPGSGKTSSRDDLKIVEGIGPKIEELFNSAGIYTFDQLATTSPDRLKSILDAAGTRFQIHDPGTWSKQAELARDGKFEELKKWQDDLNKGRA